MEEKLFESKNSVIACCVLFLVDIIYLLSFVLIQKKQKINSSEGNPSGHLKITRVLFLPLLEF